jgi:hypothetical protein
MGKLYSMLRVPKNMVSITSYGKMFKKAAGISTSCYPDQAFSKKLYEQA